MHEGRTRTKPEEADPSRSVRQVMTPDPITLRGEATVRDAARIMRDWDVGDVLVVRADGTLGIVTDRDLVVRGVAGGLDPRRVSVDGLASNVLTVAPDDPIDHVVQLMSDRALRRVPVVERGSLVGIVSLGDLAVALAPGSVLGGISAAPPNH